MSGFGLPTDTVAANTNGGFVCSTAIYQQVLNVQNVQFTTCYTCEALKVGERPDRALKTCLRSLHIVQVPGLGQIQGRT